MNAKHASVADFRCPACDGTRCRNVFTFNRPPAQERAFSFSQDATYHRQIDGCLECGHYTSLHEMDDSALYDGDYVDSNYEGLEGIAATFDKIMSLPPESSDNVGRVSRVLEVARRHLHGTKEGPRRVLDIGSGLCVFLARMKEAGWEGTALDPDPRAVAHAEKNVGVRTKNQDVRDLEVTQAYELVTLNRVLEHVHEPIELLKAARRHLDAKGILYIEVPDGERAELEGKDREEFTIDHPHVFSFLSLCLMIRRAGLSPILVERQREPSSKHTLRAFTVAL